MVASVFGTRAASSGSPESKLIFTSCVLRTGCRDVRPMTAPTTPSKFSSSDAFDGDAFEAEPAAPPEAGSSAAYQGFDAWLPSNSGCLVSPITRTRRSANSRDLMISNCVR